MSAAFLPFLKKKPVAAPKPAVAQQEEEDPIAVPLPPPKPVSKLSTANTKFVSKLNGKPQGSKPASGNAGARVTPPPKGSSTPGTTKLNTAAAGHNKNVAGKPASKGLLPGKGAAAAKPAALSPAQAKAEAEKRRLKQLERLAKLGTLASKDTPPEVLAKYEQAKQQAAEIKRQQELAAKRKLEEEQRRRAAEQRRQQMEQERQRLAEERLKLRLGKAGGSNLARPATPPPGTAAAAAGPGRGPSAAAGQGRPAPPGARPPAATAAAGARQQGQGSKPQQDKDPYAHLNPKQRAFLLARKREREGRMGGRMGSSDRRRSGSADGFGDDEFGYGSDEYDDLDDFICDDDEGDWRSQLRAMTGYDPRKYNDSLWDDRKMEASAAEIAAEERRSARMGKAEDEREAEAEARRLAAKEAKRSKKRGASALFDD